MVYINIGLWTFIFVLVTMYCCNLAAAKDSLSPSTSTTDSSSRNLLSMDDSINNSTTSTTHLMRLNNNDSDRFSSSSYRSSSSISSGRSSGGGDSRMSPFSVSGTTDQQNLRLTSSNSSLPAAQSPIASLNNISSFSIQPSTYSNTHLQKQNLSSFNTTLLNAGTSGILNSRNDNESKQSLSSYMGGLDKFVMSPIPDDESI